MSGAAGCTHVEQEYLDTQRLLLKLCLKGEGTETSQHPKSSLAELTLANRNFTGTHFSALCLLFPVS